jgi:glycosyltransferase involved in cell wall biosynthesis
MNDITVVIPVYNGAKYLRRCLKAIQDAKRGRSIEVVAVDDASPDHSADIIRRYPVKLITLESNRGPSYARNRGAQEVLTEYILFIDADVILPVDTFDIIDRSLLEAAGSSGSGSFAGLSATFSLESPLKSWQSLYYNCIQHLNTSSQGPTYDINTAFLLIRAETFRELGGFSEQQHYLEDVEIGKRLKASGSPLWRAPVFFTHMKQVSWSWLLRSYVLGGRITYGFKKTIPGTKGATKRNRQKQRPILHDLLFADLAGSFLLAGFLFPWHFIPVLQVIAFVLFCAFMRRFLVLLKISHNPFFVALGAGFYLTIPLLILYGFLSGLFARSTNPYLEEWRNNRN